ncbi:hypothetical protein DFH27DRAFT_562815 [Peziza echinospora]|nr:hypothetical protein DFH27DRAFT_562815 [Peziza echinospora]
MASENDYATENEVDDKELIRQEWKRRLGKTKDKKSMEIRGGTNGSTATVTLTSENTPIPDSKNAGSNSRVGIGSLRGLASVLDRKNRQISGSGLSVQSYTTALVGESERDDEPNEQNMNLDRMPGSYSMTFDSATKNRNAVSQESHPSQGTPKTPARKSRDRPSGSTHGSRDQYVGGLFERSPRQYTSKKPALGRMSLSPQEERHCYPPVVDGFEDSEQTPRAIPDRTSRTYSMKFESPKNTDKKASTKAPESRNADKKPATKTPEVKRSARKVTNPTVKTIPDDLSDGHGWRWNPEVGGYVDDEGVSVPPMDNDMPSEYEGDAEEIQPRRVRQGGRQSEQRESTRSNSRVYEMHRGRDGGVTGRTDYHGSHVFVERRRRKKRE